MIQCLKHEKQWQLTVLTRETPAYNRSLGNKVRQLTILTRANVRPYEGKNITR